MKKKAKEYKDLIIELGLPEGFALLVDPEDKYSGFRESPEVLGWIDSTGDGARLGVISLEKHPIRMFVKVIGFLDTNAPTRSWGKTLGVYGGRNDTRKKSKPRSRRLN